MPTARALYLREHPDIPVFDRGRTASSDPQVRAGLSGPTNTARASRNPESSVAIGFAVTPRDRRPGTPLPPEATGDPAPDRLERAEALRLAILKKDARTKIEGSVDRVKSPLPVRGKRSCTPDVEKPRCTYIPCPPELAILEARRGDQVLLFATRSDACRVIGGERKEQWIKSIENAASGVTTQAFGWSWTRLRDARSKPGPRRVIR